MSAAQRILVAEDDPENLLLLQTWLGEAGYLVLPAPKGKTALEWLEQAGKPDLAVLDRTLPDMDGLDLCRAIRSNAETRKIPVLILTARADNAGRIEAGRDGADLYLNKPIEAADLLNAVETLLRQSGGYLQRRGLLAREGLQLDPERRVVTCAGKTAQLSGKLFDLLYVLAENHPEALSRPFILRRLGANGRDREVDVLVSLLRTRLRRMFRQDLVETVAGRGYRLRL